MNVTLPLLKVKVIRADIRRIIKKTRGVIRRHFGDSNVICLQNFSWWDDVYYVYDHSGDLCVAVLIMDFL